MDKWMDKENRSQTALRAATITYFAIVMFATYLKILEEPDTTSYS
jgi:hypothetical protein